MQYNKNEFGRSLIEMLATLAVMGVLSVGSIAGFNYAMNKHRANELLDEARKRAYTVMTQTQLGLTRSLSEYSRHNTFAGGTFSPEIVTKGLTGQFGLQVTNVTGRVCKNLEDTVSENTIIRKIFINGTKTATCNLENNTLVLIYNDDLSEIPSASDFDGNKELCENKGYTYCSLDETCLSDDCCFGHKNSIGSCVCDKGYTGTLCEVARCTSGQYCGPNRTCCAAGEICTTVGVYDGQCVRNPTGICTVNADCNTINPTLCANDKCFCRIDGKEIEGVHTITGGTCIALEDAVGRPTKRVKDISGHVIYPEGKWLTGPKMNYWAAKNWCQAQGTQLVKIAELGLSISAPTSQIIWNYLRQAFEEAKGYCWTADEATARHAWGPDFSFETPYINTPRHAYNLYPICR